MRKVLHEHSTCRCRAPLDPLALLKTGATLNQPNPPTTNSKPNSKRHTSTRRTMFRGRLDTRAAGTDRRFVDCPPSTDPLPPAPPSPAPLPDRLRRVRGVVVVVAVLLLLVVVAWSRFEGLLLPRAVSSEKNRPTAPLAWWWSGSGLGLDVCFFLGGVGGLETGGL